MSGREGVSDATLIKILPPFAGGKKRSKVPVRWRWQELHFRRLRFATVFSQFLRATMPVSHDSSASLP